MECDPSPPSCERSELNPIRLLCYDGVDRWMDFLTSLHSFLNCCIYTEQIAIQTTLENEFSVIFSGFYYNVPTQRRNMY